MLKPSDLTFQSTRPVRGATNCRHRRHADDHISIHAPRAGRDCGLRIKPRGKGISIHAPRAGRDENLTSKTAEMYISIHAPRAGRDCFATPGMDGPQYFNPRAPCGARLVITSA